METGYYKGLYENTNKEVAIATLKYQNGWMIDLCEAHEKKLITDQQFIDAGKVYFGWMEVTDELSIAFETVGLEI
jgi:hypothetical protein